MAATPCLCEAPAFEKIKPCSHHNHATPSALSTISRAYRAAQPPRRQRPRGRPQHAGQPRKWPPPRLVRPSARTRGRWWSACQTVCTSGRGIKYHNRSIALHYQSLTAMLASMRVSESRRRTQDAWPWAAAPTRAARPPWKIKGGRNVQQSTKLLLLHRTNHIERVRFYAHVSKQELNNGCVVILRGPVKRRRVILGGETLCALQEKLTLEAMGALTSLSRMLGRVWGWERRALTTPTSPAMAALCRGAQPSCSRPVAQSAKEHAPAADGPHLIRRVDVDPGITKKSRHNCNMAVARCHEECLVTVCRGGRDLDPRGAGQRCLRGRSHTPHEAQRRR